MEPEGRVPVKFRRLVEAVAVIAVGAKVVVFAPFAGATSESPFTSIYTSGPYVGAGWAACATPITWYADTSALKPAEAKKARSNLAWAMSTWASAAGLSVVQGSVRTLTFDNADSIVKQDSAMATGRKIYVKFVKDKDSTYMSGRIVGAASPTKVLLMDNEIVGGSAAFRADYLTYATKTEARALLLHELGHVFGLGHTTDESSVMYPLVQRRVKLNSSDLAGIRAFTKPCNAELEAQRNA